MIRLATILLILNLIVTAQTKEIKVNLREAISIALENNHDLKQARLQKQKADEQIRQAFGESVLPSVEGIANYSRTLKRPEFFLETPFFSGSFPSGTYNNLVAGVQVEQPIAGGAVFLATKIAKTYAEIARYREEYSEAELIMNVKDIFYTYLLAKEYITLSELQLKRAEENLKNTKAMYSVGRVSDYDRIRANVQYQNSIPTLTEANNQIKLAANNLKIILGLNLDTELKIDDHLGYSTESTNPDLNELQLLLNNNKLLKQSETQNKLNDLTASYQYAQHYPSVTAFGNWQMQAQENDDRSITDWRYRNSISVGLNLRVPIFKGFSIDSKYQQAKIDLDISNEAHAKLKNELESRLINTNLSIQKVKEQIESYKLAVEEADKGFEIAKKRYSSGVSSQIEITDALVAVTSAKINLANSIYQYLTLNARRELLIGKSN